MDEENNNGQQKPKESVGQKAQKTAQNVKDTVKKVKDIKKKAQHVKNLKNAAHASKFLTALGPALPYIGIALLVILIIIFLIGIIVFILTMPGMVMEKLKAFFEALGNAVAAFFGGDTSAMIKDEEVYEILDYLEDMGYDLKGYGFLTAYWDEDDVQKAEDEDDSDQEGEPDNGVIRGKDDGKIIGASSEFILTYIMSDNYIYTVKNFNVINDAANKSGFWNKLWGGIVSIGQKIAGIFVDEGAIWGKGMIYLEDQYGNEWQDGLKIDWTNLPPRWETIYVDAEAKILSVTRGAFANAFQFSLDGWTGRYGMPLEFLLSVHLATNMPDLAYDMVQFFGTVVTIRMDPATADVKAAIKNDKGELIEYTKLKEVKDDGWWFTDSWCLSKEEAKTIMEKYGFESQTEGKYNCTGVNDATITYWPDNVNGKSRSDAFETLGDEQFIQNLDDLKRDYDDEYYTTWAELYDYIYENGHSNDDGTYTFSLPNNGTFSSAAFKLSVLKQMLYDIEDAWDKANSITGDNKTNPFRQESYIFYELKELDSYPDLKINNLWEFENKDEISVDIGNWTKLNSAGEDEDYVVELKIRTTGLTESDNWEYCVIIYRDMTQSEIEAKGWTVENGDLCSNNNKEKCCSNCRKYIKRIMNVSKEFQQEDMATYTPYIRKVTDHWYRDVYFVAEKELNSITIDEEYEALMKERWTMYETDETTGQTIWYKVDAKGNLTNEVFDGTIEEAQEQGIPVARKAITDSVSKGWSAYEQSNEPVTEDWEQAYPDSPDEIKQRVYFETTIYDGIKQVEEGVRVETNPKIKRIFLNNYYFKYDGNQETAEVIYKLRNEKDLGYGNLNGDKGKGGSDSTLKANLKKSITATIGDNTQSDTYYVSEYASKVDLTKDALSAFSMLENTHTEDADYIYKDFKELIVELGYFEKEELAENVPEIFQWFIPEIGSGGYPIRAIDKKENMYGTMAHSKNDYEALQQFTILAQAEAMKAAEAEVGTGSVPETNTTQGIGAVNSGNTDTVSGGLANVGNTNVDLVSGATSLGAIERISEDGDGYHYKVKVGNVTYTHFYQFDGSYKDNEFIVDGSNPPNTIHTEGCGPTSCCNILTGYGHDITPADTAGFLKQLGSNENLEKVLANWDLGSEWIAGKSQAEYVQLMEECVTEGKPFVVLMNNGNGGFWTSGGHFVAVAGVDGSGNMITLDTGSSNPERHTFTGGLAKAAETMEGILVPDEAPTGASKGEPYEGFEGGEAVVAPVTGILLEYGTYEGMDPSLPAQDENGKFVERGDRLNYDLKYPYSGITGAGIAGDTGSDSNAGNQDNTQDGNQDNGQQDISVGGVTSREVYDKVGYAKILVIDDENYLNLENAIGTSEFGGSLYNTDTHQYVKNYVKDEDMVEALSDDAKTLYSFKEFAEIYDAFDLDGHIIYIDGFKTELPNQEKNTSDSEDGEEETEPELGSGEMLSMQYFKDNAKDYEHTFYEKNPAYNYTNEDVLNRVKAEDTIKSTSAPLYYDAKHDLVFIKEGTVIGRTYSDKEVVEELRGETYKEKPENATSVEDFIPEIVGNYLRIVMRDRDDTVVENIEEYLKLDDEQTGGGDQPYNFTEQDLNELAILVHYEGCVEYFKNKGHSENEAFAATALTGYCTVNMALNDHNHYVSHSSEEGTDLHKVMMSGAYASSTKEHIKNGDPSCASCIEVVKHISEKDVDSIKKPSSDGTSYFNVGDSATRNLVYQAGWCAAEKWGAGSANCFWHIDTNKNGTYTWYPNEPYDEGFGVCMTCCKDKK